MRKFAAFILIVLLASAFIGCADAAKNNDGGTTYNPALPAAAKDDYKLYLSDTFNSVNDLSDKQGYRNWFYYCGDPDDNSLALMAFNDYYGRWCSSYQQLFYYTYMWGKTWLPEDQQGMGIGMSFKAPATGTISYKVVLRLLAHESINTGDGVVFTVSGIKTEPYKSLSITPAMGGADQTVQGTLEVAIGENVMFMLFPNTNNANDFTDVDITVTYTGA